MTHQPTGETGDACHRACGQAGCGHSEPQPGSHSPPRSRMALTASAVTTRQACLRRLDARRGPRTTDAARRRDMTGVIWRLWTAFGATHDKRGCPTTDTPTPRRDRRGSQATDASAATARGMAEWTGVRHDDTTTRQAWFTGWRRGVAEPSASVSGRAHAVSRSCPEPRLSETGSGPPRWTRGHDRPASGAFPWTVPGATTALHVEPMGSRQGRNGELGPACRLMMSRQPGPDATSRRDGLAGSALRRNADTGPPAHFCSGTRQPHPGRL